MRQDSHKSMSDSFLQLSAERNNKIKMKPFTRFFDSTNLLNKLDFNIYVDRDILFRAPIN